MEIFLFKEVLKQMSISVLDSSALAMLTQTHAMGQISTNIANINTTGYKASESTFQSLMSTSSYSPNQGFSATFSDRRQVDLAGTTVVSGNVHDMTISGDGFFMVSSNFEDPTTENQFYTRAGDFRTMSIEDSDGLNAYLVSSSGHYVLGWNADRATGEFGNTLEPIRVTPLETIDGVPTSEMDIRANISSDTSSSQRLDVPVYDNSFKAQGLTFRFDPVEGEIANQWMVTATVDNGTVTTPPFMVRFDDLGNMIEPANGDFSLDIAWDENGASSIDFDMSDVSQLGEAGTLLYNVDQDGMESGQLIGVAWDDNGVLHGQYSNTRTIEIAKVAISTFTAQNNLEAISGNLFKYNQNAGEMKINDLSNDDLVSTGIVAETYELSNVDLEDQFSRMITTQKAYSSAATVFQTGDEMLQTATALKG